MTKSPRAPASSPPGLPLVVQVSFAGSRSLFDPKAYPDVDPEQFHYVTDRLRKPKHGQLDYYSDKLRSASLWLTVARATFYLGSIGAVVATSGKLGHVPEASQNWETFTLGFLAVMLPVIAVAALSLAASFDTEARKHTYEEMSRFLNHQTELLEGAASENEFAALAMETEARLLGETASWYARRAFTGVT